MAGRSTTPPRPAPRPPKPETALAATPQRTELAEMIRQQAIDTQKILDGGPASAAPRIDPTTGAPPPRSTAESANVHAIAREGGSRGDNPGSAASAGSVSPSPVSGGSNPPPGPATQAVPPGVAPIAAPVPTLDQRVEQAAGQLADLLKEQSGASASLRPRAALAALGALRLHAEQPPIHQDQLTPAQREALDGLREAIAAFAASAEADWSAGGGDPPLLLAEELNSLADRLTAARGIGIADLRLCTRVRGFGQYSAFALNRFVAGRAQRALVYVEIERFGHREVTGSGAGAAGAGADAEFAAARDRGERWVVDVTQEINLYSEQGNLLVQRHPPERVVEASRSKRRDMYLVTEMTLPATLAVGVYHLKVTLRDQATGAVTEKSIPIEIVADAGLVRGADR